MFDNLKNILRFKTKKIKKKVDLRGYIFLQNGYQTRHYFWGEGQNYSNNLEIFFDEATIHIDKFFSKARKEQILLKIFSRNNKLVKFKPVDHFELMFNKISKIMKKKSFKILNYSLINKQSKLMHRLNK